MTEGKDIIHEPPIPHKDVSWLRSKIALQEIRRLSPPERISAEHWSRLTKELPNLTDYLVAAAYSISPDEPTLRAEIAALGASIVTLLAEAEAVQTKTARTSTATNVPSTNKLRRAKLEDSVE